MKTILTICLCLFVISASTQVTHADIWGYYESISDWSSEPEISTCDEIGIDVVDQLIFEGNEAKMEIVSNQQWQSLFEWQYNWKHIVGQEPVSAMTPGLLNKQDLSSKCSYLTPRQYSSKELVNGFDLHSNRSKFIKGTLKGFPFVRERNDPLNRIWVPVIAGDYLVLRYVHSYPDGNMTSFYSEIKLYFKKKS